jgi:uncharacterized protein (TIGR03435 family)
MRVLILGLVFVAPITVHAQVASFEVASIKRNTLANQQVMMVAEPNGRLTATSITLAFLIRTAYHLQDSQIVGGPKWLSSDRFDILAKGDPDAFFANLGPMMQSLLADRFKLAVHRDARELPVFALVVAEADGRLGPRLRPTQCPEPPRAPCATISNGVGRLTFRAIPMGQIVQFLSPSTERVVIDRTRLSGNFDVDLEWTPDVVQRSAGADVPTIAAGPSIFTAVREQLGLRLEATNAPVEVLVIDHVEPPTPD